MSPGTRKFIGPLTPAQQRRRLRNRRSFAEAQDISETRCISMRDAFEVARRVRVLRPLMEAHYGR